MTRFRVQRSRFKVGSRFRVRFKVQGGTGTEPGTLNPEPTRNLEPNPER